MATEEYGINVGLDNSEVEGYSGSTLPSSWSLGCDVTIEDENSEIQDISLEDITMVGGDTIATLGVNMNSSMTQIMDLDVYVSLYGINTAIVESQIVPYGDILSITDLSPESTSERRYASSARASKKIYDLVSQLNGKTNTLDGKIENTRIELEEEKQHTERRFATAEETLNMIQNAFGNFTESASPVTVRTMALLVGDKSLQFKFIPTYGTSDTSLDPDIKFNSLTKKLKVQNDARLMHMTLGIDSITSTDGRDFSDYLKWELSSWESQTLTDATKSYYLYACVNKYGVDAQYILKEDTLPLEETINSVTYYNLLVGILNSELKGNRDFVSLYGFTEILPSQITTALIRSADGNTYFDLENGEIGGKIVFTGTGGKTEELSNWSKATDSALAEKVDSDDLANLEESLNKKIADIQGQVDGVIETWFYDEEPTLTNLPASNWNTKEEKENHVGDLYYSGSGKSYRWQKDASGNYYWNLLADEDLSKVLESVQKAQDTANNKKRVFIETPSGPYDVGDLWADGTNLMVCNKERTSGFSPNDWKRATDYTNDAKAEEALTALAKAVKDIESAQKDATQALADAATANRKALEAESLAKSANDMLEEWLADGVFSKAEISSIKAEQSRVEAEYNEVNASAIAYGVDASAYLTAYNNYNSELNKIISALGSNDTTESSVLATYQTAYYSELKPLLEAIAAAAKALADQAIQSAKTAEQAAKEATDAANILTDKIDSDGYLTELEKQTIRRTLAEITECQGTLLTESAIISMTVTTGETSWNKVKKGDVAKVRVGITNPAIFDISQDKYVGYYGSNMHSQGASVVRLKISKKKDFKLKLKFLADTYSAMAAYAAAGALGQTIDPVYSESKHGTDQTKTTYTYPYSAGTEISKEYNITNASSICDISFYKASAVGSLNSRNIPTDSAYFTFLNDHYTSDDGKDYIIELNGSFHRYYLLLMQLGYSSIANELANKLQNVFDLLNSNSVWEKGTTELREGSTFRSDLNAALTDYYFVLASCGFDVMDAKVSDFDYLANAMRNGKTIVEGGLVMTSLVAVGDTETTTEADVEAFINGSDFAEDETHGKLLIAGGIPETVTEDGTEYSDLEKRAKKAKTRVYEDGTTYSDSLILETGCKIGVLNITDTGISATEGCDQTAGSTREYAKFNEDGFHVTRVYNTGEVCSKKGEVDVTADGIEVIGNSAYDAIDTAFYSQYTTKGVHVIAAKAGFVFGELNAGENEALQAIASDSFSFFAKKGKMAGLRPNIQTATSGSTLTEYHHTLIIASGTLYLPASPLDGQEYKIIHTSETQLAIRNTNQSKLNIWDFKYDTQKRYVISSESKETIELIYNGADATWYVNRY